MDEPYLDIKNADPHEGVEYIINQSFQDLDHMLAVTFLKIKLLLDLKNLEKVTADAGPKVPREILDNIRSHSTVSSITASNQQLLQRDSHTDTIEMLTKQVKEMYQAVKKANKHIWDMLVSLEMPIPPSAYSRGSKEEANIALINSLESWAETPGALFFMQDVQLGRR